MVLLEKGNFRSIVADNGNGKLFLGQQTINGNLDLLFKQMCPSMIFILTR